MYKVLSVKVAFGAGSVRRYFSSTHERVE